MKKAFKQNWGICVIGIGIIAGYWLLTDAFHVLDPFLFVGPSKVLPAFAKSVGKLFEGLLSSLKLLVPAYVPGDLLRLRRGCHRQRAVADHLRTHVVVHRGQPRRLPGVLPAVFETTG